MADIHETVRWLEQEVDRLTSENRSLELDNAQYRQRALDAETQRDKAMADASFLIRENGELSAMLENLIHGAMHGMKRYRANVAERQTATSFNLRSGFTRTVASVKDDTEETKPETKAAPPPTPVPPVRSEPLPAPRATMPAREPAEHESEASRALRTSHSELNRVAPEPPKPPQAIEALHRLTNERVPRAVSEYVRPGSTPLPPLPARG